MEKRCATAERCSKETKIEVSLCLDGEGRIDVATGFGMLDHMLTLTFFWAGMDLTLRCKGDLEVDAHHTVEDCALVIGEAMQKALGDRAGIARVGYGRVPMDEALAEVTVDISGRPYTVWLGDDILPPVMAGEERDVWREWYKTLANTVRMNLHVSFLYGKNGHHIAEALFKACAHAVKAAVKKNETGEVLSTKGVL